MFRYSPMLRRFVLVRRAFKKVLEDKLRKKFIGEIPDQVLLQGKKFYEYWVDTQIRNSLKWRVRSEVDKKQNCLLLYDQRYSVDEPILLVFDNNSFDGEILLMTPNQNFHNEAFSRFKILNSEDNTFVQSVEDFVRNTYNYYEIFD